MGVRSTPNYADLATAAIHDLKGGGKVFAGQRKEGFYVDLGSIFDLGALRPFQNLHLIPMAAAPGVNGTQGVNVHSIAVQVPLTDLTTGRSQPSGVDDPQGRHRRLGRGVPAQAPHPEEPPLGPVRPVGAGLPARQPALQRGHQRCRRRTSGTRSHPQATPMYADNVAHPQLAALLPVLYPGVFPNLAGLKADRADLLAILLTGIPSGLIDGFQNYTGSTQADMLRLNVAVPPADKPNIYGILGGDLAGFPNGRRVADDVTAIELRAIAGATYPLVDPSYTPDAAAGQLTDGLTPQNTKQHYLKTFPYLATPLDGFDHPSK